MRLTATPVRGLTLAALVLPFAFVSASCGKKNNDSNTPTSPTAAATPAPAPTPTPRAADPTPPPAGTSASCQKLTPSNGTGSDCRLENPVYDGAVSAAIDGVSSENVDGNTITYVGGFFDDVIKALDAQGYCAVAEGDNLFVRGVGDAFNEYYDVITSRGDRAKRYTNTCRPAVPTPAKANPPVRDPSCKLPPSTELFCTHDSERLFEKEVYDAIEAVVAEDRARAAQIIFDFNQRLGGSDNGWKVIDIGRYHDAVVGKLRAKGLCAWFDSEEIQVKNSNRVSAHWDIIKAEGFRIQLWAGVCRDASF